MTQNKIKMFLFLIATVSIFSSCAKKESGIRATVKTQQTNLNPAVSTPADQQGAAANANYKITTISIPELVNSSQIVNVELTTPSGQILPVRTHHEAGQLDSEGVYTDNERGLQVYIQARCSQDDCFKYTLIVTTWRNNQPVYQSAAISYKNDCKFNSVSASFNVGTFLTSLNDAENKYPVVPKNDIDSCPL